MASLSTSTNSGTQTTTQSPQTAGQGVTGGANTSQVQPGTASNILTQQSSSKGVLLSNTPVTTVDLGATTTGTQTQKQQSPATHHVNPALFGVSALLFVVAIALFWFTGRSEKNTTN